MSPDDATDSQLAGNAEAVRASLVEYKELQEEKRVIAQSMYAAIALVAGGVLGLAGAAAQSDKPDLLMLVPFVMLGGAVVVVVLRSHLMRISVYLGMTERAVSRRLRQDQNVMGWETTMSYDTDGINAGRARLGGSSLQMLLALGVSFALVAVALGVVVLSGSAVASEIGHRAGMATGAAIMLVSILYVGLNLVLLLVLLRIWHRIPQDLEAARHEFVKVKLITGERPLKGKGSREAA